MILDYKGPVKVTDKKDVVNVMDFKELQKQAVELLKEKGNGSDLHITDMKIGYARTNDPSDIGKMTLVPAVYYIKDNEKNPYYKSDPILIINAIDGTDISINSDVLNSI